MRPKASSKAPRFAPADLRGDAKQKESNAPAKQSEVPATADALLSRRSSDRHQLLLTQKYSTLVPLDDSVL